MHIEFLVEETSAETALTNILPRIVGLKATYRIHAFQGKPDLLAKLAGRLRGYQAWLLADWRIVVLLDRDHDDCRVLKARLEELAAAAGLLTKTAAQGGRFQVLNRLAITGSINETEFGWCHNWESFHVFSSWEGTAEHVDAEEETFQTLWADRSRRAIVLEVPAAVWQELLKFLPSEDRLSSRLANAETPVEVIAGMLLCQAWLSGRARRLLVFAPKAVLKPWQIEPREKFNLNWPIYDGQKLSWYPSPDFSSETTKTISTELWSPGSPLFPNEQQESPLPDVTTREFRKTIG